MNPIRSALLTAKRQRRHFDEGGSARNIPSLTAAAAPASTTVSENLGEVSVPASTDTTASDAASQTAGYNTSDQNVSATTQSDGPQPMQGYTGSEDSGYAIQSKFGNFTQADVNALAAMIYGETGAGLDKSTFTTPESQALAGFPEAQVAYNRSIANNQSLSDVIGAKGQFLGYNKNSINAINNPENNSAAKESLDRATSFLQGNTNVDLTPYKNAMNFNQASQNYNQRQGDKSGYDMSDWASNGPHNFFTYSNQLSQLQKAQGFNQPEVAKTEPGIIDTQGPNVETAGITTGLSNTTGSDTTLSNEATDYITSPTVTNDPFTGIMSSNLNVSNVSPVIGDTGLQTDTNQIQTNSTGITGQDIIPYGTGLDLNNGTMGVSSNGISNSPMLTGIDTGFNSSGNYGIDPGGGMGPGGFDFNMFKRGGAIDKALRVAHRAAGGQVDLPSVPVTPNKYQDLRRRMLETPAPMNGQQEDFESRKFQYLQNNPGAQVRGPTFARGGYADGGDPPTDTAPDDNVQPGESVLMQERAALTPRNMGALIQGPEASREQQPVMDPATMGQAWDTARRNYQNFPVQEGEAIARPLELGARDVIGGSADDDIVSQALDVTRDAPPLTPAEIARRWTPPEDYGAQSPAPETMNKDLTWDKLGDALSKYPQHLIDKWTDTVKYPGDITMGNKKFNTDEAIQKSLELSQLAMTGGIGGAPEGAVLGSGPVRKIGMGHNMPPLDETVNLPQLLQTEKRRGIDILNKTGELAGKDPQFSKFGAPLSDLETTISRKNDLVPYKVLSPEQLYREGAYIAPALGDLTGAGYMVHEINGIPLSRPVDVTGGGEYMRSAMANAQGQESAWASRPSTAQTMLNKINSQVPEGSPVYMSHTLMGVPSMDSSHMVMQGVLRQIPHLAEKIDPVGAMVVDDFIRSHLPAKAQKEWPGIMNADAAEAYLMGKPGTWSSIVVKALDKSGAVKAGFPDVGATRFAMMEPRLAASNQLSSGFALSRLDPGGKLISNPNLSHETYSGKMPSIGGYAGGFEHQVPMEAMFSDWAKGRPATYTEEKSGLIKPTTKTMHQQAMMTQVPVQKATQQWLDTVMAHMRQNPQKWGYLAGGAVKP